MKRHIPIIAALVISIGCASRDQKLVANAAAAQLYAEGQYEADCVLVVGPADCKARQEAVNKAKREVELCNRTQKIGKLPVVARARLRDIAKRLPTSKYETVRNN